LTPLSVPPGLPRRPSLFSDPSPPTGYLASCRHLGLPPRGQEIELSTLVKTSALLLVAATLVVGFAPTAAADIVQPYDVNMDGDCNDPGEEIRVPAPITRRERCLAWAP
ncbi:MAG TPA: hypothetical protein VNZ52_10840, partial [Candidatus Thermoplasmatota archaeon]|nr:hypothetical protein [Candidatus Thermoplasmatota archaeon]